jgi:hypothetical protein
MDEDNLASVALAWVAMTPHILNWPCLFLGWGFLLASALATPLVDFRIAACIHCGGLGALIHPGLRPEPRSEFQNGRLVVVPVVAVGRGGSSMASRSIGRETTR